MNKKLFLGIGIAVLCIASVLAIGYTLVTTSQTIQVVEGIEMTYKAVDGWKDVDIEDDGTVVLPIQTLKPGQCIATQYAIKNTAPNGALNVNYQFTFDPYTTTNMGCDGTNRNGLKYYTGESRAIDFKLNGDNTWKYFALQNCLDGAATMDVKVITGTLSRENAYADTHYTLDCDSE